MLQKPDPGISATPTEHNLRYFNVVIAGPQDSAYDGACGTRSATNVGRARGMLCGPMSAHACAYEAPQLILRRWGCDDGRLRSPKQRSAVLSKRQKQAPSSFCQLREPAP
jgi:hypothetical protein